MPGLSQIDVSNLALAKCPASPIASLTETSLEARECSRFYPQVVRDMLDGPHDWSFANVRVVLAVLATNPRATEWAVAYQLPTNVGNPIRVIPDLNSLGLSLPIPLPGDPFAEGWANTLSELAMPYEIEGQTLYTNAAGATLEYTVSDLTGMAVSQLAITALSLELASRIVIPIKKDEAREKTLIQQAEVAWSRAIADDRNRQPEHYGECIPEAIAARHGDDPWPFA